ncbi:MBL fold metallo-hydrolase [Paenibacillus sp. GCM10023252]|uniref:MBL fold metallo-hydrolase n=1 Tax=Paenibacillus sp. GCM10023252 TaxID=3252649 RepID=UPI00361C451C
MTTELTFLGTGDSMGVPRVYCSCEVCEEARGSGHNRRLRSSLHISDSEAGEMLIDCGPDWGRQMEAAGLRTVNRILLTHAHFDHIGGLVEWADACRWQGSRGEAYAPAEVIVEILDRFPWLDRHIHFQPIDESVQLGSWLASCWKVNHGKNGYSYAYRFENTASGKAWAYCSDAIGLTLEQQKPLHGLELLILGTSFYHEPYDYETRSVYDVVEAMELLEVLQPQQTLFTHMSHDIDLTRSYGVPECAGFARTGMRVQL